MMKRRYGIFLIVIFGMHHAHAAVKIKSYRELFQSLMQATGIEIEKESKRFRKPDYQILIDSTLSGYPAHANLSEITMSTFLKVQKLAEYFCIEMVTQEKRKREEGSRVLLNDVTFAPLPKIDRYSSSPPPPTVEAVVSGEVLNSTLDRFSERFFQRPLLDDERVAYSEIYQMLQTSLKGDAIQVWSGVCIAFATSAEFLKKE